MYDFSVYLGGTAADTDIERTTKMKIATLLYSSNYPNFAADSLWIFNRILFSQIVEAYPEIEVLSIGSSDMPQLHPKISHHPLKLGSTKFEVRFGFPWGKLGEVLRDYEPDICFINMPEQAANFSALVKDELGIDCKIVNYVHYIPASLSGEPGSELLYEPAMNRHGNCQVMLMRILEGLAVSDCTITCSRFGANLLHRIAGKMLQHSDRLPPIAVLPPPYDPFEGKSKTPRRNGGKVCFAYNHRLYDEYGTHDIFDMLCELHRDVGPLFEVLVTNPTAHRHATRTRLNPRLEDNIRMISEYPFVRMGAF